MKPSERIREIYVGLLLEKTSHYWLERSDLDIFINAILQYLDEQAEAKDGSVDG